MFRVTSSESRILPNEENLLFLEGGRASNTRNVTRFLTIRRGPLKIRGMSDEIVTDPDGKPQIADLARPRTHRTPAVRKALTLTVLFLLPTIIFAGVWRLGGVSALEDDLIYYLPIRQYIGERIRVGEFP